MPMCGALHCYNKSNCFSLFRFPKDEERCKIWLSNSGRSDLNDMSTIRIYHSYKLCSVHFETSQFMNAKARNKLIPRAVPTLFNCSKPSLQDLRTFTSVNSEKGEKNRFQYSEEVLFESTFTTVEVQESSESGEVQIIHERTDGQVIEAFEIPERISSGYKRHLLHTSDTSCISSKKSCNVGTCTESTNETSVTCNATTQTFLNGPCPFFQCRSKFEMFEKKTNERQTKMRKKIQAQRMKIMRMEIAISKLKNQKKDSNEINGTVKLDKLSGFAKDLLESQIKLQKREKNGRRYSETVFSWALSVYRCSPAAYFNMSKQLCLPSVRSLQKAIQKSNESTPKGDCVSEVELAESVTAKDSTPMPLDKELPVGASTKERPLSTLNKDLLVKAENEFQQVVISEKACNVASVKVPLVEENQGKHDIKMMRLPQVIVNEIPVKQS